MKVEDLKLDVKTAVALVMSLFALFFALDDRYSLFSELRDTDADLRERILMSESTRYAEIEKYYTDIMLDGQALSESQQKRLRLAQKQQERIAEALK